MHGFFLTGFFEAYITKDNPLAVPIAVLVGVPMYSNAAGVLPAVQVLVQKGIPIGTAIAFSMAVVGLSIRECKLNCFRSFIGEVRPFINIREAEDQYIEAYGVSPSKNRWVGNVPKFASLNEARKAAVTAEIENVDSTTKYSTVPENKIFWMCTLN